jgi:hypothetical protein
MITTLLRTLATPLAVFLDHGARRTRAFFEYIDEYGDNDPDATGHRDVHQLHTENVGG